MAYLKLKSVLAAIIVLLAGAVFIIPMCARWVKRQPFELALPQLIVTLAKTEDDKVFRSEVENFLKCYSSHKGIVLVKGGRIGLSHGVLMDVTRQGRAHWRVWLEGNPVEIPCGYGVRFVTGDGVLEQVPGGTRLTDVTVLIFSGTRAVVVWPELGKFVILGSEVEAQS